MVTWIIPEVSGSWSKVLGFHGTGFDDRIYSHVWCVASWESNSARNITNPSLFQLISIGQVSIFDCGVKTFVVQIRELIDIISQPLKPQHVLLSNDTIHDIFWTAFDSFL